jgi:LysM repeat protein
MSDSSDDKKRSQDQKKMALALATLPITIVGSLAAPQDAASAAQSNHLAEDELTNKSADDQALDLADQPSPAPRAKQSVYTVQSADTISAVAKKFGTTARELMKINNLSEAALLLPGQVLRLIDDAVHPSVIEKTIGPATHTVKSGETLSQIAGKYSLKLSTLLALNNLQQRSLIYPGQHLNVREVTPASNVKPLAGAAEHKVSAGETLSKIAAMHKVSLPALLKANRLTNTSLIFVGQTLEIPSNTSNGNENSGTSVSGNEIGKPTSICLFHGFHKVKPGETISKIASVFAISSQSLLSANGLSWNSTIYIGQKLVIPGTHNALDCPRLTPLTDEMKTNAQQIIDIGRQLKVGDYGIVIALATAMQESSLRNIAFGDRDSVGLFQQRPSAHWGTKTQILNTDYAIRAFFGGAKSPTAQDTRGLLDIANWQRLALTEAAQSVQISAHPTAYAKWEPSAWNWLIELDQLEDS